jgi:hypothetical protein
MSDYFLNRIYNSLLSGKPVPKKPSLIKENKIVKKSSTLQHAYHTLTLKRINEETEILMQRQPDGELEDYKISDELANKIRDEIDREKPVATKIGTQTTVPAIITEVLQKKGWIVPTEIIQNIISIFRSEKIVPENIAEYSEVSQASKNSFLRSKLINTPETVVELSTLVPDWFNSFFVSKNGINVVSKLWNIRVTQRPTVGRGEIALSLISDCKKGHTGDLYFDDGKFHVELKGLNGYVEDDGYYASITPIELNNILKKYNLSIQETSNVYRDAIVPFFQYKDRLSEEDIIDGIYSTRNYKNLNNPEGVKAVIKQVVLKGDILKSRGLIPKNITNIIGALHLCAYQEKKKFRGIIFANDNTLKMTYFQFKGNDVSTNLLDTYNFLMKFNPLISLTISSQQRAASFRFNFK